MKLCIKNYGYYNIFDNPADPEFVGPVLVLCGREKNGKFHAVRCLDKKFTPHFFVDYNEESMMKIQELDLKYEVCPEVPVYHSVPLLKIFVDFPWQVKRIRKYFTHTYNADVTWEELAMMTLQLRSGYIEVPDREWVTADEIKSLPEDEEFFVKTRVFYYDIESDLVDHAEPFSIDNCNVISVVVYDNYLNQYDTLEFDNSTDEYWKETRKVKRSIHKKKLLPRKSKEIIHHCTCEAELLKEFFKLFKRRPDAWCGFNSHGGNETKSFKSETMRVWENGFDEPVIIKRALYHRLNEEMQTMSPLPVMKNKYGRYYGVYTRGKDPKFEVVVRCLTPLDIMRDVPKMGYLEKYRDFFLGGLDDYLLYFAHIGKVQHVGLSVAELKEFDLEKELRYNRRDVEGCVFLDELFGLNRDIFDRVSLTQVNGIDIHQSTKVHNFLTRKFSLGRYVYDTKWQGWSRDTWHGWINEKKDLYGITMKKEYKVGGYNVEVERGASGPTMVMDFSRLYPNLIRAANVGLDTIINVKEEHDNYFIDFDRGKVMKSDCNITPTAPFLKKHIKESLECKIYDVLIENRDKLKKKLAEIYERTQDLDNFEYKMMWSKEYNLKQGMLNNRYGAKGNRGSVDFNLPCYAAAPAMAQPLIRGLAEDFLPSLGYHARMGDTDSVAPNLVSITIEGMVEESDDLIRKANVYIKDKVKELYNIDTDTIALDWEKIGDFFYAHAKKNYLLHVVAQDGKVLKKPYTMYKGFKLKKRDRADITETIQKVYFKLAKEIMEKNLDYNEVMVEFIKRTKEIFPYILWNKLCSRIVLKRKLVDYSLNWINRRAAEFSNDRFGTNFTVGDRGFMGIVDVPKVNKKDVVMMFRKEDVETIKDMGYSINTEEHKQKFIIDKLNLLFDDYDTSWYILQAKGSASSPLVF